MIISNNVKRAILNSIVVAGIVFLSTLSIDFPPKLDNVWASTIGALLSLLTQIKTTMDSRDYDYDDDKKPPLGMLI